MVRYCHNCGHEIQDNEHFCSKCGQKAIDLNPDYIKSIKEKESSSNEAISYGEKESNSQDGPTREGTSNSSSSNGEISSNHHKTPDNSVGVFEGFSNLSKFCCGCLIVLLVIFMLIGLVSMFNSNGNDDYLSDDNFTSNSDNHFTINLENGTYLKGMGSSKLIDYNYSSIESYENFTISGYETYKVDLNDGNWFIIDVYKIDYNTPASDWVYNSDTDEDGLSYIFYNTKGEYHGYFINIPDSSDNSTYQTRDFLTGIFHRSYDSY